jgi:hypothetical protein
VLSTQALTVLILGPTGSASGAAAGAAGRGVELTEAQLSGLIRADRVAGQHSPVPPGDLEPRTPARALVTRQPQHGELRDDVPSERIIAQILPPHARWPSPQHP